MKKLGLIAVCLMFLATPLAIGTANAEGEVSIYGEYLTSDGDNYGAKFYADNNLGVEIYVDPYIVSRDNVYGDVVYGVMLMQPYEKRVLIGTFTRADQSKGWSVYINAKWKTVD